MWIIGAVVQKIDLTGTLTINMNWELSKVQKPDMSNHNMFVSQNKLGIGVCKHTNYELPALEFGSISFYIPAEE